MQWYWHSRSYLQENSQRQQTKILPQTQFRLRKKLRQILQKMTRQKNLLMTRRKSLLKRHLKKRKMILQIRHLPRITTILKRRSRMKTRLYSRITNSLRKKRMRSQRQLLQPLMMIKRLRNLKMPIRIEEQAITMN